MAEFTLTVRSGPRVERETHGSAEEALAALARRVEEIAAEGDLPEVKMLRTFKPDQRVKARLEISTGKIFRRREAGVDLMGDGAVVPYTGGAFKRPIDSPSDDYLVALAEALGE